MDLTAIISMANTLLLADTNNSITIVAIKEKLVIKQKY